MQIFQKDELIDEQIVFLKPVLQNSFRLVRKKRGVARSLLIWLPSRKANLKFILRKAMNSFSYPKEGEGETINISSFFMDRYPVTNYDYKKFLDATEYKPTDTANFLKHWKNKMIPKGQENFPVIYVSYERRTSLCRLGRKVFAH